MRRQIVLWSLFLLSICTVRIVAPGVALSFAGFDFSFAVLGSVVALTILTLTIIFERIDFRWLFAGGAAALFTLFLLILYFPTLGGLRETYVSAMDIFVPLECSIILAFAALEEKKEALPVFTALSLLAQLLAKKFRTPPTGAHGLQTPRYS
ncbi:MAG TPA: hypothetical protein VFI84_02860 [Candidatus Saccharimonadales bacterium]|nr:hypothetical protein [Candidatus Saccharimonadales bacterium]